MPSLADTIQLIEQDICAILAPLATQITSGGAANAVSIHFTVDNEPGQVSFDDRGATGTWRHVHLAMLQLPTTLRRGRIGTQICDAYDQRFQACSDPVVVSGYFQNHVDQREDAPCPMSIIHARLGYELTDVVAVGQKAPPNRIGPKRSQERFLAWVEYQGANVGLDNAARVALRDRIRSIPITTPRQMQADTDGRLLVRRYTWNGAKAYGGKASSTSPSPAHSQSVGIRP